MTRKDAVRRRREATHTAGSDPDHEWLWIMRPLMVGIRSRCVAGLLRRPAVELGSVRPSLTPFLRVCTCCTLDTTQPRCDTAHAALARPVCGRAAALALQRRIRAGGEEQLHDLERL